MFNLATIRVGVGLISATLALSACGSGSAEPAEGGLPGSTVWSGYSIGSQSYAENAAVAEALTNEYGTRVRMIGSDTGIGRMTPLKEGQADMARVTDDSFYAFEAMHQYASEEWGPQDVRAVWAPLTTLAVGARSDSGIEDPSDLEGAKVPWMPANPSPQEKIEGLLAYAGLTPDDVTKVSVDYTAQPEALKNGQLDIVFSAVEAPGIMEVANQIEFEWLDLPKHAEGEARFAEIAPTASLEPFQSTVGMSESDEKHGVAYPISMIAYADYDSDAAYAFAKAFDETFDQYSASVPSTESWSVDAIDWMPRAVPFHEGTVRYLTEKGIWTDEHEAANQQLIERGELLREGWKTVIESDPANLVEAWEDWKAENAPR